MALDQITRRISRASPYFWVTWLTKLVVGENSCEWAAWFKGHYQNYGKVPNGFDLTSWQMNHTALLKQIQNQLEADGSTVFTENQNRFTLRGSTASLGGKPDLIAFSGTTGTIYDAKTGKPDSSHHIQVMVYMYAIPRSLQQYKGIVFDGKVVYQDHTAYIPSAAIDEAFIQNLARLIQRVSSGDPAQKVPSPMECQFCDITRSDCPERAVREQGHEGVTDDF